MSSSQRSNYLRANRKRLALSQEEVAFLLGAEKGGKVCRYERFFREPGLQTALAYEAVFRTSVSALFPALYEKMEKEVAARAKTLASRIQRRRPTRSNDRKQQTLKELSAPRSHNVRQKA